MVIEEIESSGQKITEQVTQVLLNISVLILQNICLESAVKSIRSHTHLESINTDLPLTSILFGLNIHQL